ncbi:hypothetical protein NE236_25365 [Actinoallomurus purpureus]|uniref:hypothetical protein n=1 Tax=Actinoallomurus purpureus TaxID=478114 RepID=UPI002092D4EC|nr:hypothetical protein [Actinoallomurus purpureus]MCO6008311.1 hypothetical protein [Actinoallomurus purpureus]
MTSEVSPVPNDADPPRVVIDESTFDFRRLSPDQLSALLDRFNDELTELKAMGCPAWKPPMFENASCHDEHELYDYLTSEPGSGVDRDVRNRFYSLIQKCPEWDASAPTCDEVALGDGPPITAWSVAYALTSTLRGQGVACLVLASSRHRSFVTATTLAEEAQLYFFADNSKLPPFWRFLYELENVPEGKFFELTVRAFPKLIFHEDLTFKRFEGSYRDLRSQIVRQLADLNDHFLAAHTAALGRANEVNAILMSRGSTRVSPESPKTHQNAKAMRERYVWHEGREVCCEWHSKIEGHRNRIHFAFGDEFGDRILIGIFVDHLTT